MPQDAFGAEVARLRGAGIAGQGGRLADLFDFLAGRGPDAPPATQAEIAGAVFRQALVDADDASVRVYVHRLRKRLEDLNLDPHPGSPEQTGALLNQDIPTSIPDLRDSAPQFQTNAHDETPRTACRRGILRREPLPIKCGFPPA